MIRLKHLITEFRDRYGREPSAFSAPGRVNLIGEHTDYNQGFVLPFAIDKRAYVLAARRDDGVFRACTLTLGETAEFRLGDPAGGPGWVKYLRGVASILAREHPGIDGADILIDSDIPFGAGLSSSAALEISAGSALVALYGLPVTKEDLAFVGQQVEHEFLGVRSGIMDQFASALSLKDNALLIDCRSLEWSPTPLRPVGAKLIVCDTRVKHELAAGEYNKRRQECEEGVEQIQKRFPDVHSLRDVTPERLTDVAPDLDPVIFRRCRHVVTENVRTLEAVEALEGSDLAKLGSLMFASHRSLKLDYEVSCAELDLLVDVAAEMDTVIGSRMTGGGFGGCTISLIRESSLEDSLNRIKERFGTEFGYEPDIFEVTPSDGEHQEAV